MLQEKAEYLGYEKHPYDALINRFEEGLTVDDGISIPAGYTLNGNKVLLRNDQPVLDVNAINELKFAIDGFSISDIINGVEDSCTITTRRANSNAPRADSRSLNIRYELLEKDEAGGCTWANIPVRPSQGRPSYTINVLLQRELSVLQENVGLHDAYLDGERGFGLLSDIAVQIINQHNGDLLDAIAIYYWAASYIAQSSDQNRFELQMGNLLKAFFDREWAGQESEPYTDETIEAGE